MHVCPTGLLRRIMEMNDKNLSDKIINADPVIQNFLNQNNLADAVKVLLQMQRENWRELSEGYKSLGKVQNKTFPFGGFKIKVQYNPKRITST